MADFKSIYNVPYIQAMSAHLLTFSQTFDASRFVHLASQGLDDMEMKARAQHIAKALHDTLPGTPEEQMHILVNAMDEGSNKVVEGEYSLKQPWDPENPMWKSFYIWPWTMFVQQYGQEHVTCSLNALYEMTQRFTGEFAIQPFIQSHPEETFCALEQWVHDDNVHVRRLVSEGTRTRLPWGRRMHGLIEEPQPVLALLAQLRDDPELYVQRSVANNLNDLTKDKPELILDLLEQWQADSPTKQRLWIIKHALRSLVKDGHPRALNLMGYQTDLTTLDVELVDMDAQVTFGNKLNWTFTLRSTDEADLPLLIDYRIDFVGARDQLRPKIFKWKTVTLKPGATLTLSKSFAFKAITTRQYYDGTHQFELQINGQPMGIHTFELTGC